MIKNKKKSFGKVYSKWFNEEIWGYETYPFRYIHTGYNDGRHIPSKTYYLDLPPDITVENIKGKKERELVRKQLFTEETPFDEEELVRNIIKDNFSKYIISKIHLIRDPDSIDHLISAKGWGIDINGKSLIYLYGYVREIPNEIKIGEFFNTFTSRISTPLRAPYNEIEGAISLYGMNGIDMKPFIPEIKKRIINHFREFYAKSVKLTLLEEKINFNIIKGE
ncbi:MAG: hypothetical protein R6W84_04150 [Promethearchaeia archaeon]